MSSNLIHCLLWSGGVSAILVLEWIITSKLLQIWDKAHPVEVLEWIITSKLLQIWDKAHPVDPRKDGDHHRPKDR